jgi:transcriptional regulator with XRE-family HTH domain
MDWDHLRSPENVSQEVARASVARYFQLARQKKKMTMAAVARKANVAQSLVSRKEAGCREWRIVDLACDVIGRDLGVKLSDLVAMVRNEGDYLIRRVYKDE